MSQNRSKVKADTDTLAEDARALLVATSEVATDKVAEARKRLSAALERGKEMCGDVRDKAILSAKAGDKFVRGKPYAALGIAMGVGLLIGFFVGRSGDED